jgi:peptide/nickel transport system permease protein
VALLVPLVSDFDPATARDYSARLQSPSLSHWLGTDGLGRDLGMLVIHGMRISLGISAVSVGLGLTVGTSLGLMAGYFRGGVELVTGWVTDILLAFPSILLAIAIVTVMGPGLTSTILAISLVQVPIFIRLSRSMVLSLRERSFVDAVRALGASPGRILVRHILPASVTPLMVQTTLAIGTATLEAAGLGFLGLGVQPPTPELGTLLSDAFANGYALSAPWTILGPGLVITTLVLAFNLLGDGLRDSLDPHALGEHP